MSVHPGGAWCHRRPEEGVISPGTGVVSCHVVLFIELGPSERVSSALRPLVPRSMTFPLCVMEEQATLPQLSNTSGLWLLHGVQSGVT